MNRLLNSYLVGLSVFVLGSTSFAQSGGGYDLTLNSIAGGGGFSTGGGYDLGGTIGRADAEPMTGGGYMLEGGFWPGTITTPPSPVLPDPDSPGGLACGGGPNYGLGCSVCDSGSRAGQLCTADTPDCPGGGTCLPEDALCPDAVCGTGTAAHPITQPYPKQRYIGFLPPDSWAGQEIAVRVTLDEIAHDVDCNTQVRWLGAPELFCEGALCNGLFNASKLTDTPHFADWTDWTIWGTGICIDDDPQTSCLVDAECDGTTCLIPSDAIQMYGEELGPESRYSIQGIDISGAGALGEPANYSNGMVVDTGKYGDAIAPYKRFTATIQPSILDIFAVVKKWKGFLDPIKAHCQLFPYDMDPVRNVDINDVSRTANGWRGFKYSESVSSCPP